MKRKGIIIGSIIVITTMLVLLAANVVPEIRVNNKLVSAYKFINKGNYKEAILIFEKVLDIDKKNIEAMFGIADAATELGDIDYAINMYEDILNFDKENGQVMFKLAEAYYQNAEIDDAISTLRRMIEYEDAANNKEKAYLLLADIYSAENQASIAEMVLLSALELIESKDLEDELRVVEQQIAEQDDNNVRIFKEALKAPVASYLSGTYEDKIDVGLSTVGEYDIFYTLDGSEPDEYAMLYVEEIEVSESTLLKTITYDAETASVSPIGAYNYDIVIIEDSEAVNEYLNDNPLTETNWLNHDSIVEVREVFNTTQQLIQQNQLAAEYKEINRDYGMEFRTLLKDPNGVIVKYIEEGGTEDSYRQSEYYYDINQTLRFIFVTEGAANGTSIEQRIYFDAFGNRIWINVKKEGEGYPGFGNLPEENYVFDPLNRFMQ